MAIKKAMIPLMNKDLVNALNKGVEVSEDGFEIADPVEFDENVQVDGNLAVNGENIYFMDTTLGVDESRICSVEFIPGTDEWKQVADAYSETTKLAHGITAANVVENQWTSATTPPPGGESIQDGEILYVVGFIGTMVVLCLGAGPDVQYWYSDDTTLKLKINTGTYTVIKDTYAGYTEGEEGQKYHKFGYVEEVECNINPDVETIVQDALYDKSYDIASLNIPSTVTILEVFVAEDNAWYQPSRSSSNADDVYDYVHFFATDSADDVAITKIKILR